MNELELSLKLLVRTVVVFEESGTGAAIESRTGFCVDLGRQMQARGIKGFNPHTLESYLIEIEKGRHSVLEGSKKITNALSQFATGKTYSEFKTDPPEVTKEQEDRVLRALKLDSLIRTAKQPLDSENKLLDNFIEISELTELEYQKRDIEINVITYSLEWLDDNLPRNIERIRGTNNEYRYLVTEDSEKIHLRRIKKLLTDNNDLKDRIRIKTIYNSDAIQIEEIEGIRIPVSNDIVIFRQRRPESGRYEFRIGIVSNSTTIDEKYVLKINEKRANDIMRWFEEVWKRLPDMTFE